MRQVTAPDRTAPLGLDELPAVGLDEVIRAAALERRFDQKHLVQADDVPRLVARMGDGLHVLEVAGRRMTDYTSVYFDTPDLRTYRDHVQRRRRRFKIRTRHYGDPTNAVLELKAKGRRRQTVKFRWPHPGSAIDRLDAGATSLLAGALDDHYGLPLPTTLVPIATTTFRRITLADLNALERITIDLDIVVAANDREVALGGQHAVVETKSPVRSGRAVGTLRDLAVRPHRVSKYCIGLAATHDGLRGNPWMPVLRRLELGVAGREAQVG